MKSLIRLKKIHYHNWMGFKGDLIIDCEDKDIIGILAEYENDPLRSNRGGKSSLIEGVDYNLTGNSRAKNETALIHHGEKEMFTENTYTDGERDYVIKRGRDYKGKGILELDWIQKNAEVEEEIEKLFGVSKADFHLTSFFKQADTEGFMKKSPADKAKFLMQWIDNEHWKIKEKKVNDDRNIVKQKLRDNENLKKTLEASLEIDESLFSMKSELEKANAELEQEKDKQNTLLAEVNSKLRTLDSQKSEVMSKINKLHDERASINKSIASFESDENSYLNCRKEYAKLKKDLEAIDVSIDEKATIERIDKLKEKRTNLKNILNVAAEHKSGVCPILQASCDRLKADPKQIEGAKKDIEELNTLIKMDEKTLSDHRLKGEIQSKMATQQERGKRFKDRIEKKPELLTRLKEIEDKIPELSDAVKSLDLTQLQAEKKQILEKIDYCVHGIKANSKNIFDMEIRIEEAKRAKEKIDAVVEANAKLQQKLSLLNYTHFAFKTIPALEIENSFQEIEDNINYILDHILTGVTVSFAPDKELKALEPVCDCGFQFPKNFRGKDCPDCESPRQNRKKEEITFKILENGIEQDFEMDSGGGKQVISYAVRIALTMLKRAQRKCNLNILFLDEVDSALDPYLAGQIVSSITNFLTKKLGYEQVFLVSHKEQIKSAIPHIIKVTKHDTYSTARFL